MLLTQPLSAVATGRRVVPARVVDPAWLRARGQQMAVATRTIDGADPAWRTRAIDTVSAVRFREARFDARHLRLGQPKEIRHVIACFRAVDKADRRKSTGPVPDLR